MKIGDVFNFAESRIRVLMFDDNEVFYGTVDKENVLVYCKYKTISYYRTSRSYFDENSSFIKSLELTEKEKEIHKPDLPLRLNCFTGFFWSNKLFEKEIEFNDYLKSVGVNSEKLIGLDISKVVLVPNSQQQANKKPILLKSVSDSFSGQELLFESFRIQSEYVKLDKPYFSRFKKDEQGLSGIGMYRLGIKGNVPSYYLGGEMNMMEWEYKKARLLKNN
ncbi:hypothetical protein M4I21_18460 [Cellulophaga sp. 20_2_10]|uniref:hypothetical protein n=1 Tax=Cellulophaga sp. 20_2_10 TaxID=2942476 RepID=UPI00201A2B52|nr:hypothetical protein [Cellulophaga sp. 20_2_10]MCL5247796.1 hypothetical protein [Cellulophaga sp. 20_2_10]